MKRLRGTRVVMFAFALMPVSTLAMAQTDPGPRGGAAGAGGPIAGLTLKEGKFFDSGLDAFQEVASVTGSVAGTEPGLGPRFNLNSCAGCHAHPAVGGSSPADNPQFSVAPPGQLAQVSGFISSNGPVREVRFSTDGGVHDLFTIVGLPGTPTGPTPPGCTISQPDFAGNAENLRFRIPTPVFGAGLIEAIEDATIAANERPGKSFGITGKAN